MPEQHGLVLFLLVMRNSKEFPFHQLLDLSCRCVTLIGAFKYGKKVTMKNYGSLMLYLILPVALLAQGNSKSDMTDVLKQRGFKLSGETLILQEESDFDKDFRNLKNQYNSLMEARKRLTRVEQLTQQNRDQIKLLMQQRSQVGRQLANTNLPTQVHNGLVAQYNSLGDDISHRIDIDNKAEELTKAKNAYSTPRNQFMKAVVDLKTNLEKIKTKYAIAVDDDSVRKLLDELSKQEKKKIALGPSRTHLQNQKEFARYEALVLMEDIPLETQRGTHRIDVMLNGKAPIKMIFDTGASSISLSHETALKVGLKPSDKDMEVKVTIANGRTVKARMLKLDSVRVGKFEVKNVECIVMPDDLPDSPSLLGGSFLNHFKYEVDTDSKKLRLSKIEASNSGKNK